MLYSAGHQQHVDRIAQIGPVALKWNESFSAEFSNTEPSIVNLCCQTLSNRLKHATVRFIRSLTCGYILD